MKTDVAIIGGGPAGSTVGALLKRYSPSIGVVILEREEFPRDHVGESHLPAISPILDEMGAWDKIEAANFPVKIGGTYKWGATDELWDLDFLVGVPFKDEPRPAKFVGQRLETAFQVDRSIYDKVLLDHARDMGCDVFEQVKVGGVRRQNDKVTGLEIAPTAGSLDPRFGSDPVVEARYYVDASGETGILRRAMDIEIEAPTALRNIAFWDYWHDATWAVTLGTGGTKIQIMSLGWGWVWFIPITETRTSVGLVLPADHYKATGKSKETLYQEALASEPLISKLLKDAKAEGNLQATKDWNFLASRLAGDNWLLAGDSCGFADPILSAGMTLAHTSGRKAAFTILELMRGQQDPKWLLREYSEGHRTQIKHHMQFADYWYAGNGRFTDLKAYCTEIAETAGLSLDPDGAFRWLASGGFALEEPGLARALSYPVGGIKYVTKHLGGADPTWEITKSNLWLLKLADTTLDRFASYRDGRVVPVPCYRRGNKLLPVTGVYAHLLKAMKGSADATMILQESSRTMVQQDGYDPERAIVLIAEGVEALIAEGWVKPKVDPNRPAIRIGK